MECKDLTIGQLLPIGNFIVPDYQRPYTWDVKELEEFFKDLINFIQENPQDNNGFYLFGQIIVHDETSHKKIVDGQQRIATSTIFLCVLRDYIEQNCPEEKAVLTSINNSIGFDISAGGQGFKLTMGRLNQEFFVNYVQLAKHETEVATKFDKKVKNAYDFLYSSIASTVKSDQKYLRTIANSFLDNFHVSYVQTTSEHQAFIIFETLNSRGVPLSAQDLLKNLFFSKIGNGHIDVVNKWTRMTVDLSNADGDMEKFIKYYWTSRHNLLRIDKIGSEFSKLSNEELELEFNGMYQSYKWYIDILHPENKWSDENIDSITNLKAIGAKLYIPLLLALKTKNCDEKNIQKILKATECLFIRNQVILKQTSNTNEVFFAKLAERYYDETMDVNDIIRRIYAQASTDDEIKSAFSTLQIKQSDVAKMILINLYNMDHSELKIKSSRKVHVEHIMPQTKGQWDVDDVTWQENVYRLGNMVLLDGSKNTSVKNELFEKKKIRYLESDFEDTKSVAEYDQWTPVEISDRQNKLFAKVCKCWPIPRP